MRTSARSLVCALMSLGLAHPMRGQRGRIPWQAALSLPASPRVVSLSRNGLRRDLIGCYALYFERGRVDGSLFNAAPSVRLDSMSGRSTDRKSRGAFRSMTGLSLAGHPTPLRQLSLPASWTADSLTDSVRLSFVDGFSGAVFVLDAPAGQTDTLRGRVFESWDAGSPFVTPRGPAYAVRELCLH